MTYYVLRQIRPPGRSARAHEATAPALAAAAIRGEIEYGKYLEWADPDANDGMGDDRWSNDIAKARRFDSFTAAMECWRQQSRVRPFRDDGKPNRPLTAYSVTPEQIT